MKPVAVYVAVACACLWSHGVATAVEGEIRDAVAGLKSSVEAIDSLTCDVSVVGTDGTASYNTTGVYRRSGDREMMLLGPAATPAVSMFRDGLVVTTFSASSRSAWVRAGEAWPFQYDPWTASRFRLAQKMTSQPAAGGARALEGLTGGKTDKLTGTQRPGVAIHSAPPRIPKKTYVTLALDLDSGYNHAMTRFETTTHRPDGGMHSLISRMERMKEVSPGLYFPGQVVVELVAGGAARHKLTVEILNVKVNQKVAPGDLAVRFPKGTTVSDQIKMVEYKSDAAGNPDGPVRALVAPSPPTQPAK